MSRDEHFTRPVPAEEIEFLSRFELLPLCSAPRCEQIAGHEGDHGPVRLTFESLAPPAAGPQETE